jgi:GldM C-terminal domain
MTRQLLPIKLLIASLLLAESTHAQKYSVTNPHNNFVYAGMETRLEAIVEGIPCKSIVLRAKSGKIEKDVCNFLYYPNRVGIDTITVFTDISGITKKIGNVYFNVRHFPEPEPFIGNLQKGIIKKGYLMAQQGVGATLVATSYGHEESIHVDNFTVTIFRNTNIIFNINNQGNIFNDSIKTAFESLKSEDVIIVSNITATGPGSTVFRLRPIELTVE